MLAVDRALRLDLRPPGPVVWADPASLGRAVSNLLSNDIRLAPRGSTMTVTVGGRRGWSYVSVADAGPGIAEEDRTLVFERLRRGTGDQTTGPGSAWQSPARSPRATTDAWC